MRLWTPEEDADLTTLWDRGMPISEIAKAFRRRKVVVRGRIAELGLERDRALVRQLEGAPPTDSRSNLLVVDIETMANLAWTWGVWDQNIAPVQIVKHKRTISWAAKWVGEPRIYFASEFHGGRDAMVRRIWNMINQADGVIGYNSKRFDIKHLNTEFKLAGYGPPSSFQHIDLLQVTRREFAFGSNKLESVADRLGLGKKRETEGFALWLKTEAGDADAWKRMREYNMNDVVLTEKLFEEYREWIPLRGRQSQKTLKRLLDARD
jgi:DNA polymerase elongation subunit (family B)